MIDVRERRNRPGAGETGRKDQTGDEASHHAKVAPRNVSERLLDESRSFGDDT